jgi:hypothetical protein
MGDIMRVLYVINSLTSGGAERIITEVAISMKNTYWFYVNKVDTLSENFLL